MKNNKIGRPKITLSPEQITELEQLASSMTIEQIAGYFGMSESTFQRLKENDFDILTAYKKGKSAGIKEATGMLWEKIRQGDTASILFYLKTQAGWNEKQVIDMTTKDTTPQLPALIVKQKISYEKQLLEGLEDETAA